MSLKFKKIIKEEMVTVCLCGYDNLTEITIDGNPFPSKYYCNHCGREYYYISGKLILEQFRI